MIEEVDAKKRRGTRSTQESAETGGILTRPLIARIIGRLLLDEAPGEKLARPAAGESRCATAKPADRQPVRAIPARWQSPRRSLGKSWEAAAVHNRNRGT
jgi:hypothetical protein